MPLCRSVQASNIAYNVPISHSATSIEKNNIGRASRESKTFLNTLTQTVAWDHQCTAAFASLFFLRVCAFCKKHPSMLNSGNHGESWRVIPMVYLYSSCSSSRLSDSLVTPPSTRFWSSVRCWRVSVSPGPE